MSEHGTPPAATELSHRAFAMLRAVAQGRAQLALSCEPDLFVDGLPCCDQLTAHALVHSGLIRAARPGHVGERVAALLTGDGHAVLPVAQPLAG